MNPNQQKFIKMFVILAVLVLLVGGLTQLFKGNSQSLSDYASRHPQINPSEQESNQSEASSEPSNASESEAEPDASSAEDTERSDEATADNLKKPSSSDKPLPVGALLNGDSQLEHRTAYSEAFYYEPLSDNLRRYITGVSFPQTNEGSESLAISYEELSYLHILHYDFNGELTEGELICNKAIAPDLVEIFYELYRNEYQLEKVRLIDEYDGDDTSSMEDNNTSCFNYRKVEGSSSLSKHALGRAIDINPLYNPYVTYNADGSEHISPENAQDFADRSKSFPYKIDEDDLCYKLFTEHGFIWGGNWNSSKDYQHFQKTE